MRHHSRPETGERRNPKALAITGPGKARAVCLAVILTLGSLLMGCEILDNLGAGTGTGAGTGAAGGAALPATTALLEESRRLGQSPFEVLERRYKLKKAAITVRYDREIKAIDTKVSSGTMTSTEAAPKKKLAELKKAQELAALDAVNKQRKSELTELSNVMKTPTPLPSSP